MSNIFKNKDLIFVDTTNDPKIPDEYVHTYYIRHSDDDWSLPAEISKKRILVNLLGLVISKDDLLGKSEHKLLNQDEQNTLFSIIDR